MRLKVAALAILATVAATPASAAMLSFNGGVPAGMSLAGSMIWHGVGGGHLYMEQFYDDDFINFAAPTTVTSFQMNSNPWEGYGHPNSGRGWVVDIEAFDNANHSLWARTIDLTGYYAWSQWLTVNVGVANVSRMAFYSPYNRHQVGFWPAIDNLVINEQVIPEPSGLLLLGLGMIGLARRAARRS